MHSKITDYQKRNQMSCFDKARMPNKHQFFREKIVYQFNQKKKFDVLMCNFQN